jgi:hypothetical protein
MTSSSTPELVVEGKGNRSEIGLCAVEVKILGSLVDVWDEPEIAILFWKGG